MEKKQVALSHFTKEEVLADYRLAWLSRHISLFGRKEVLSGKAKFGIFGDGKELPQLALAKVFRKGDWRSGYYRDQTLMLATGMTTPEELLAQLYGDTDLTANPSNGGRSFNNHFGTRYIGEQGSWKPLSHLKNSAADLSPTAAQMPRLIGLAYASKLFRENKNLHNFNELSYDGNEIAFGTIGDASTSEGHFFETMNAAGVLQIPLVINIWDDGYGISVPKKFQTTKESISELLKGFEKSDDKPGFLIYRAKGWDYEELCRIYQEGVAQCRQHHIPILYHIEELTQPIGHSTSGSHERYKSKERLEWERNHDCLVQFRDWIIKKGLADASQLSAIEEEALLAAREALKKARKNYRDPIKQEIRELAELVKNNRESCPKKKNIMAILDELEHNIYPVRKDIISSARRILRFSCSHCQTTDCLRDKLKEWLKDQKAKNRDRYNTLLYSENPKAAIKVSPQPPQYDSEPPFVNGSLILKKNFEALFEKFPKILTFGEDTGKLGDVNQGLEGLQKKFGTLRITDTGIRETTIIGQGIGCAMRGLRPIAEIQYFDYLLYALQIMSDDLATLHWRTKGGQKAPLIIRTRGHRLEGIWHSGSPLSMVINSIRGIYVCVPRNMTQAAGFYNTLMEGDDPALVIEPLSGYRLKEKQPSNPGEFKVPLGIPETLQEGKDVTLITYGACVRIAQKAVQQLEEFDISVELIDVQTLLPFDIHHAILDSIKKTNRVIFFDEDVPGGATAFMMQKVVEEQGAFWHLDSPPQTITAKEHRPAYSTDGDYFSNPNEESVFNTIYHLMQEVNPGKFSDID